MTEDYPDDAADNTIPCPYCQGKMALVFGFEGVFPSNGDCSFRQGSCDDCGMQTPRFITREDVVAWVAKLDGQLKLH